MHGVHRLICAVGAALMATIAATAANQAHAEVYSWTQHAVGGLEARAITDHATCPVAEIDGRPAAMQARAQPGDGFPITVCTLAVPDASKVLLIAGRALPLPAGAPKRIAVIGDTGCRLKGSYLQACNDLEKWPFRRIAEAVAAKKPDLIIHVGDYHYRETTCPIGDAGCAGSPFGDNWSAWREDFFAPALPLLSAAPWVAVRGNHEECARGGRGWSRTLEAADFNAVAGCNAASQPFIVQLPQVALAVVDTSLAPEPTMDEALAAVFRAQYALLAKLEPKPIWLLQHRPIWSTGGVVAGLPFGDNKTLALAARDTLPAHVQFILSGHHHIFQVLSYAEDLPAQIVVGHGGDFLNKGRSTDPAGWTINGATIKSGLHQAGRFGFAMLEPHDGTWVVTNYDQNGAALQHCSFNGRQASCATE